MAGVPYEIDEMDDETFAELLEDALPLTDNEIEEKYANLSFRVIYQSNNFFLPQIRDLIKNKEVINLRPEYQRRLRWSAKQKSLLIESLLLNIPVPPIFLYESELARYEVMDGQQRLNAVHQFLENEFKLSGLEKLNFLNNKRYKELPPKVRRGLERSSLSAIVLLRETKADEHDPFLVRRYVFERLNTGGKPLNAQEIRNSLYRGEFNNLITELARNATFCKLFGIPEYNEVDENEYYENPIRQKNNLYRTMGDCQIVLRFFALRDDQFIRGSMKAMLDSCMERNANISLEQINSDRMQFDALIKACEDIFDGEAFLLPPDEKGNRRISIALYDSIMVSLSRRMQKLPAFIAAKVAVNQGLDRVFQNRATLTLLVGKANTSQAVKDRINAIGEILDGIA
jgi:hypothetical protein